ncbi:hypothetical protein [Pseudomonas synxantha]|uniref:Uncharacterized protein n=1 Tax=Pseudomonas synxantha TaxID=47883 RepID=A0ABS0UM16_9PSED|nr:hypothetical protein [Pseudomonas synxantha]MBI6566640.1 hypothetical protein [Pseudomonas synxantha]MBI6579717.1 hypothetical protein [Pseudomonas synxantha]MBI6645210.1 hypothetical protein [Pseudomonas synxantha]
MQLILDMLQIIAAPPSGPNCSLTPLINPAAVLHKRIATKPHIVAARSLLICIVPSATKSQVDRTDYRAKLGA